MAPSPVTDAGSSSWRSARFPGTPGWTRTSDPRLRRSTNHANSSGKTGVMEKSWKVVEHVRDGHEQAAWEAAQALARAVLETPVVALAVAVLQGGPFALRRALELADALITLEAPARAALAKGD